MKCTVAGHLLSTVATSSCLHDGADAFKGSIGEVMAVVREASLFLGRGINAWQPPPQPGAQSNAVCDLVQQVAALACACGRQHASAKSEAGAVLVELLAAVQGLKGMRRNALVRRLQAMNSDHSDAMASAY